MAADGAPGSLSIGRLKSELRRLGVPHSDCVERSELVARLVEAREGRTTETTGPAPVQPEIPDVQRVLACPPHDHHAVLGVDREADADALKKAYRTLALRYHPDKNPDAGDRCGFQRCVRPAGQPSSTRPPSLGRFREISVAYAVVSDPEKRLIYDRYGDQSARQSWPDS